MDVIRLDSADDPRAADYREMADPQLVRRRGHFVAEGRLVVRRVIEDGRYRIRSLLLSTAAYDALGPVIDRIGHGVPVYVIPVSRFLEITGYNIHRGCLALVDRPAPLAPSALAPRASLIIVLEDIANADNVGGIFRNAAAFGASAVLLNRGCCDPLYRKAIRSSMAAVLRVPFARIDDWPAGLGILSRAGLAVAAFTPDASAMALDDFARAAPARLAMMFGSEGSGLTRAAIDAAQYRVRIPMNSDVDSLNVSVATGVALSRLSRLTSVAPLA